MPKPSSTPLFTARVALVLLLGLASGAVAGVLTYLAGNNVAAAVLAGLAAAGMGTAFFNNVIAEDHTGDRTKEDK